jgi:bifunctional non-homologous end joining protein LigD
MLLYFLIVYQDDTAMMQRFTKVEFSNLDKILYSELKISKGKIVEYYIRMAPRMLNILNQRPVVLTRFPNGINEKGFYEKDAPSGTPKWVEVFRNYSETAERNVNYVLCNNLDTLIWLANLAALELHVTLSTATQFKNPDFVFFDIDPAPPATMDDVVNVALLLKEKLIKRGMTSFVKTSGKKGLHVVIPIMSGHTFRETRDFVHNIGKELAKELEIVVSESRLKKPGTVLIDYVQNSHGKTMVCPYSLRAVPQATISAPLEWIDVRKGLNSVEFNLINVKSLQENPWKGLLDVKQKLERK